MGVTGSVVRCWDDSESPVPSKVYADRQAASQIGSEHSGHTRIIKAADGVKGVEMLSQSRLHSSPTLDAADARRASWAAASSSSGVAIGVPADSRHEHEHSFVGIPIPSVQALEEDSVPSAPPIPLGYDYDDGDYPAATTRAGEETDRTSSDDLSPQRAGERRRRYLLCCACSKGKRACCVAGLVLVVLLAAAAGGLAIAFAGKADEKAATTTAERDRGTEGGGDGSFYQLKYTQYSGECDDIPPPNSYHSCKKQSEWGKCEKDWMQGYCRGSCGTCDRP